MLYVVKELYTRQIFNLMEFVEAIVYNKFSAMCYFRLDSNVSKLLFDDFLKPLDYNITEEK